MYGLLYLRNMLPWLTFTQAAQNVPAPTPGATAGQLAAQAKAAMGDYYPVGVYCDKATFEASGPQACFTCPADDDGDADDAERAEAVPASGLSFVG